MYWHRTPLLLQWLYPGLEWHGSRKEKVLYLTFDDGPVPDETPFILETLNTFEISATFFCVGDNVRRYPDLYQRILKEGHRTGNHTMNHVKGWGTDTSQYLRNVNACDEVMEENGGKPGLFRPPYGKATRKQLRHLKGYRVIMWDVLSGDFDESLPPGECLEKTIKSTSNGSIIIFHDNVKAHERLRYALPEFIRIMLERGFEFRTI